MNVVAMGGTVELYQEKNDKTEEPVQPSEVVEPDDPDY
jgi:hypothetical protein